MRNAQLKSVLAIFAMVLILLTIAFAVTTVLLSPANFAVDNDGALDLRASCAVTTYDGFTSWNATNATLYTNIGGTWKANKTVQFSGNPANSTYLVNFTNVVNRTAESTIIWNVECNEHNTSNNAVINKAFAGNQTITVQYATPSVNFVDAPEDGFISFDGRNVNFTVSATPSSSWNLTRFDLFTNVSGVWKVNQSLLIVTPPVLGGSFFANFSNATITSDGQVIVWSIATTQASNDWASGDDIQVAITKQIFTTNRTLRVEYPAPVLLNNPADSNWSKTLQVDINFSVSSNFTTGTTFACQSFSNETGVWTANTGGFFATNGTNVIRPVFPEKSSILYGIRCAENGNQNIFNFSVNRTIRIDTISPTISVATANNSNFNSSNIVITFTPTDTNIHSFAIVANFNNTPANLSNPKWLNSSGVISGQQVGISFTSIIDGTYNFSIFTNDSTGRSVVSDNYTITIDQAKPGLKGIQNFSVDNYCDRLNVTWNTNESTNYTFYFGSDANTVNSYTNGNLTTNHSHIVNFGFDAERDYFFNITSCDVGGNCNKSEQFRITMPQRVCTGWNYYSIYDSRINLSTLQNQSSANLVYVWNTTKQNWVFFTAGTTSAQGVQVGSATPYRVVALYRNTNSTWRRNITTKFGFYLYNITSGENYIAIPEDYHFGNLSESFMNSSRDYPSTVSNESITNNTLYGPFNITIMSGWNMSKQDWINHVHNFSYANLTVLSQNPAVSRIELIWVPSDFNVSWNGTAIDRNWSRYKIS